MTPILIVLMLAAVAAAVIVLARRRRPTRPERDEADTAWPDPVGTSTDVEAGRRDDGTR
jgi:hypothetical protein